LTVPIATSPDRAGFGPQLSLAYDSGARNGPFGFGYDTSFSLHRVPQGQQLSGMGALREGRTVCLWFGSIVDDTGGILLSTGAICRAEELRLNRTRAWAQADLEI